MVLMELLDAVIDRNADILERAGGDMDNISHHIFEPEARRAPGTQALLRYPDRDRRKGDLPPRCARVWSRSAGGDVRRRRG